MNTTTNNTAKRVLATIMLILGPIFIYLGVHQAHRWYGYDFDGAPLGFLIAGIIWLIGGIVSLIQAGRQAQYPGPLPEMQRGIQAFLTGIPK